MTTKTISLSPAETTFERILPRFATRAERRPGHNKNLGILAALVVLAAVLYMLVDVDMRYVKFAIDLRFPKLIAMLITAFAIGSATIVFQSVINNRIVTPCLLGMNALYTFVHTLIVFFFTTASVVFTNRNLAFGVDLVVMTAAAIFLYGWLFKKTKYNVLYVLLIGTVLTSFFGSAQTTLTRVMNPNEYDALLTKLVASFSNVNADIILFALVLMCVVVFALRNELKMLNVITLGKNQAINLGVDYDRVMRKLLIGVTIFIAIATALVGPISFLGLILANLSRQMFKTYKHSVLIAGASLVGMLTLTAGQLVVEHFFTYSVPVSVFITVGGGIYFLLLILKGKKI